MKKIKNKYDQAIVKKKITEQREIERVQQKISTDSNMYKNQFSDRLGWTNTHQNLSVKKNILNTIVENKEYLVMPQEVEF